MFHFKRKKKRRIIDDDDLLLPSYYNPYYSSYTYYSSPFNKADYLKDALTQTDNFKDATTQKDYQIQNHDLFPDMYDIIDAHADLIKTDKKNKDDAIIQTIQYMFKKNQTPYSSIASSKKDSSSSDSNDSNGNRQAPNEQLLKDLATVARIGGKALYYTGKGIYQGVKTGIDIYDWLNEEEDEEVKPPINEEVFNRTQRIVRRGASRSRSPEITRRERSRSRDDEEPSGSNDAMRLIQRGTSRSRDSTPPKRKQS